MRQWFGENISKENSEALLDIEQFLNGINVQTAKAILGLRTWSQTHKRGGLRVLKVEGVLEMPSDEITSIYLFKEKYKISFFSMKGQQSPVAL